MHDVVIVGIPLLAILAGILFNRSDSKDLRSEIKDIRSEFAGEFKSVRAEIKDLRSEMQSGFDGIHADLRQFYHLTVKLEGRMDAIEKRS